MKWSNPYPITLANFGYWPGWLRFLMWILIFVLTVLLIFWWIVKPLHQRQQQLLQQEKSLSGQIQQLSQQHAVLVRELQTLPQRQTQLVQLLRQFPVQHPVAQVVQEVAALAQQAGVSVIHIKPDTEQVKGFYAEMPLNVTVVGTYTQLGTLLDGIAHLPEPVIPGDFQLKPDDSATTTGNLKMNVQIILLRLVAEQKHDVVATHS